MKSICLTKEEFDNMKMQWTLLIGLAFAIIIAVFATVNVGRVPVDYIFGEAYWPLVLVILGSALLGALISVCFAAFRLLAVQKKARLMHKQVNEQQVIINAKDSEILRLKEALNTKENLKIVKEPLQPSDNPTILNKPSF